MASTMEARRLTEMFRRAQLRLGAQTVAQMLAAWKILDPHALDRSLQQWLAVVLPMLAQQRAGSARLAGSYLAGFRALELGAAPYTPTLDAGVDLRAVITSLTITGPATVKMALSRGLTLERALELGQSTSAAAGMRHVLDGGRGSILESVRTDRRALGWARVTAAKPCAFCLMLASRGPVYRSRAAASFQAHDSCACAPEPIYRADAEWPPGARQARELWDRSTAGLSGAEARNAFRRAYSAPNN